MSTIPRNLPFRGNPNLKRVGHDIEWTAHKIQEFWKCSEDPVYFIENYVKIVHQDRGLISFHPYDYELEMINLMWKERYSAFVLARQCGKSITVSSFLLWYIIFNEYKEVGILANKGDTARDRLDSIKLAYLNLPDWLSHGVIKWNEGDIVLENGSSILAAATASDSVRGHSFSIVYLDECAHIENYEKFAASVIPTVSSAETSKLIMTSTPLGLNHFHSIVQAGKRDHDDPEWNGYHIVEVPWTRVPGRDEEWHKETLRQMNFDYEKFEQEQNIQFQGSSGTLISGWKLKELVSRKPLVETEEGLKQYARPMDNHRYVIVADTSEGKGLNFSAFQLIDITTMPYNQTCTFRSNEITPLDFAAMIYNTAILYNNAYILPEVTTLGEAVGNALLFDFEYDNLLMTINMGRLGKKLVAGFGTPKNDKGVRTTKVVKGQGCAMMKLLIENNQLIINDRDTIDELCRFSRRNNSYEAETGANDDLTMCLVLFAWMTNQVLFKELSSIHTLIKMRELNEEQIIQELIPFGWTVQVDEEEEVIKDKNWLWKEVNPRWS